MTDQAPLSPAAARALLDWYASAGVETAETETPADYTSWPSSFARRKAPKLAPPPQNVAQPAAAPIANISSSDAPIPTDEAVKSAQDAALKANDLPALIAAIEAFDGCALKPGARNSVVYDGILGADVLIIGEAPGREEDRMGKPFIGRAGQLLDRMLTAIDLSRLPDDSKGDVCITNTIYWRPPGNRTPTKAETAICLPFVKRFIALTAPKVILLTGNVPTQALFPDAPGITRSRGKWRQWSELDGKDIPVMPLFHPAFLLRQPLQKRSTWADLQAVQKTLLATARDAS